MTTLQISAGYDDAFAQPLPTEEEDSVPFSPQNRMRTFLVLAMLIDSIIIIGGIVWLTKYNATNSTPLSYAIIAFGGIGFKELLAMLHTHQEARQTRHDLRGALGTTNALVQTAAYEMKELTNGGLKEAVHEVGEQVRIAERDQIIADPKCKEAIEEIVRLTIEKYKGEGR